MRVVHYNTYPSGGAAVLATRLSRSLGERGVDSRVCTRWPAGVGESGRFSVRERLVGRVVRDGVVRRGQVYFTDEAPKRFQPEPDPRADVAHLHWTGRWIGTERLPALCRHARAVVLTVHDLSPLAGGCVLYDGCEGFAQDCSPCPALRPAFAPWWARRELRRKRSAYDAMRVHVVGNSEWTTRMARRSSALRSAASFSTIHPGVELDRFGPLDQASSRSALGLDPELPTIGFGCRDIHDRNKGLDRFLAVFERLSASRRVQALVFGDGSAALTGRREGLVGVGPLDDEASLARAYSAMDTFVVASAMETFCQVSIEAQACGTPVAAFAVGGLPDTIEDGVSGVLVSPFEVETLTERIAHVLARVEGGDPMRQRAADRVRSLFGQHAAAERYLALYQRATGELS